MSVPLPDERAFILAREMVAAVTTRSDARQIRGIMPFAVGLAHGERIQKAARNLVAMGGPCSDPDCCARAKKFTLALDELTESLRAAELAGKVLI